MEHNIIYNDSGNRCNLYQKYPRTLQNQEKGMQRWTEFNLT